MTGAGFAAWPGVAHLVHTARRGVWIAVWFSIVYGGANYLSALRSNHAQIYFQWELAIPCWPSAILVYDSLYVLFVLAPFVLRTKAAIDELAATLVVATTVAGLCFVIAPCRLGFEPPAVTGPLATIFAVTDALNLDYNLLPSLHVALTCVCVAAFVATAPQWIGRMLFVWAALIAISTLLTHQHHFVDVASGVVLAWASRRGVRSWWRESQWARAVEPA